MEVASITDLKRMFHNTMLRAPYYFVLDVESIGLYGDGYAAGIVVIDRGGIVQEDKRLLWGLDWEHERSTHPEEYAWYCQNVAPHQLPVTHQFLISMRHAFWNFWVSWRARGAVLVADCPFPVETNFLSACVKEARANNIPDSPYPLLDVGTLLLACGLSPLGTYPRRPDELPKHDPLADARQSARLLIECLDYLNVV